MDIVTCYLCQTPAPLVEETRTTHWGTRPVTFLDRFHRCDRCGETFYTGDMTTESFRRAAAVIRAEDGLLAPDDIVGLRRKYGLSQAQLEKLIGAGEKTVVRWERGTVAQNKTADTLLRVLLEFPGVVDQLAKERGVRRRARGKPAPRPRRKATANRGARFARPGAPRFEKPHHPPKASNENAARTNPGGVSSSGSRRM